MYQNPFQNFSYPMQTPQVKTESSLIRVTGINGAKAYPMAPGGVAALFDSGEDLMYIKSSVYANTEDRTRMEKMNDVYYRMADYVKRLDPSAYESFVEEAADIAYSYSMSEAEKAVMEMTPYGQHWTYDDVKNYVKERGVAECDVCDFYVAMNMAYNDYHRTAEKHGVDKVEFYYDIAYDYIHDEDAPEHKVAKYLVIG